MFEFRRCYAYEIQKHMLQFHQHIAYEMSRLVPRGRPSREAVLTRVDDVVKVFHIDYGYLPRTVEADEILREIWIEDTYHSSKLEGNVLSKRAVERLLAEGKVSGSLVDALEVQGYADAAKWVYASAWGSEGVPLNVVREVHALLVGASWKIKPPDDGSRPGQYRKRGITIAGSSVQTPPPIALDGVMQDWVDAAFPCEKVRDCDCDHELLHVAKMHAWFERIHPFADGNGRTGRLVMNFMLLQRGYPPAVMVVSEKGRYLDALKLADRDNARDLAEMIARGVEASINRFLIPQLAGRKRLVPLRSLAAMSEYTHAYLTYLVNQGRLKATREGRIWLSSQAWLDEYKDSRHKRGRRAATAGPK